MTGCKLNDLTKKKFLRQAKRTQNFNPWSAHCPAFATRTRNATSKNQFPPNSYQVKYIQRPFKHHNSQISSELKFDCSFDTFFCRKPCLLDIFGLTDHSTMQRMCNLDRFQGTHRIIAWTSKSSIRNNPVIRSDLDWSQQLIVTSTNLFVFVFDSWNVSVRLIQTMKRMEMRNQLKITTDLVYHVEIVRLKPVTAKMNYFPFKFRPRIFFFQFISFNRNILKES